MNGRSRRPHLMSWPGRTPPTERSPWPPLPQARRSITRATAASRRRRIRRSPPAARVTVSATRRRLKAKAFKSGMAASTDGVGRVLMKVGGVGYSPSPTTYTSAQTVTCPPPRRASPSDTPPMAARRPRLRRPMPAPISIGTTTVLKALGFKTEWTDSDLSSGTYTMFFGTLATPTADQATGTYVDAVTVALSSDCWRDDPVHHEQHRRADQFHGLRHAADVRCQPPRCDSRRSTRITPRARR